MPDWRAAVDVQRAAAVRAEIFGTWSPRVVAMIAALAAVSAIIEITAVRPE